MLDRASTFADPNIAEMLKTEFVPVAIDQAYQRRQQDNEGDFYRKIASQSPRNDFEDTTQGFYIATAAGDLLLYNNNRDPAKLRRLMQQKLEQFQSLDQATTEIPSIDGGDPDKRFGVEPPDGGLVIRVHAKVLGGYEPTENRWQSIFQEALSRDNLWVTREEHLSLVRGDFPESLQRRLATFHLVDNTRGEPPMWRPQEVRELEIRLTDGAIEGTAKLQTNDGDRGYEVSLKGIVEVVDNHVSRFDLVALGEFWGEGRFTGKAPKGKFPLAISFTLADGSSIADSIPPQGSRGWVDGYLR